MGGRLASGTVTAFDEAVGLGTVTGDGGEELDFHCTAIADGSRRIAVGTPVLFDTAPGHLGRMEAHAVTPR